MFRKTFWLLTGIVFLMALVGLGHVPEAIASGKPIVIGVPTSLYTPFGRDGLKAVRLAIEEINSTGGVKVGDEMRPLKVVVADTRGGEPGTPVHDALMAYEKLITKEKPHAILIGAFRSEVLIASMDLVAKYKVPHLGTIAQTPKFQAKIKSNPEKYKYLFRVTTDAFVLGNYLNDVMSVLNPDFASVVAMDCDEI